MATYLLLLLNTRLRLRFSYGFYHWNKRSINQNRVQKEISIILGYS